VFEALRVTGVIANGRSRPPGYEQQFKPMGAVNAATGAFTKFMTPTVTQRTWAVIRASTQINCWRLHQINLK